MDTNRSTPITLLVDMQRRSILVNVEITHIGRRQPFTHKSQMGHFKLESQGRNDIPEDLREFLLHFGGLGEAPDLGGFLYDEYPLPRVKLTHMFSAFGEWEGAIKIFHSYDANCLLMTDTGKIGWMVSQESYIEPVANSIEELVKIFAEFRKLCGPFHPYCYRAEHVSHLPEDEGDMYVRR